MASGFGKIGVLMGGVSSEREVSLRSGNAVVNALQQASHQALGVDISSADPIKLTQQIKDLQLDVAFIALHGALGEDGTIQEILERLQLPYTGCGINASQMAFNKIMAQKAFLKAGLLVAPHVCITDGQRLDFKAVWAQLKKTPVVVKPACEGSSIGVSLVRHPSEWEQALSQALKYGPGVIIEAFIKGREFTVGILDTTPLPIVEIITANQFFSFSAKYQKGATKYECPATITAEQTARMQAMALKAYQVMGGYGFARIDFRMDDQGNMYILEINTIPGFTETSLFPKAALAAGISFVEVCETLLRLAYAKHQ